MIKVIKCKDYDDASYEAYKIVKDFVKPGKILGLATGSTPIGLYDLLIKDYKDGKISFKDVVSYNLDEYVGLPISHPESYYSFMHKYLFDQVDIKPENAHLPSGLGEDLEGQAAKYDEMILANPVDIQVLGIGSDGHIAFNEPGTSFDIGTHITDLAPSTVKDNSRFFDNDINKVPKQAVSQGFKTLMAAKNIVLLAMGKNKAQAVRDMIEGPITEQCPASILQKHNSVVVITDEEAGSLLK